MLEKNEESSPAVRHTHTYMSDTTAALSRLEFCFFLITGLLFTHQGSPTPTESFWGPSYTCCS